MKKGFIIFIVIVICLMILGFLSKSANFRDSFSDTTDLIISASNGVSVPFKSVLHFFGISISGTNSYSPTVYIRSASDDKHIPSDFEFKDSIYYCVTYEGGTTICDGTLAEFLGLSYDYRGEKNDDFFLSSWENFVDFLDVFVFGNVSHSKYNLYVYFKDDPNMIQDRTLYLFFDAAGEFLFGSFDGAVYSPYYVSSSPSVQEKNSRPRTDWTSLFGESKIDFARDKLTIKFYSHNMDELCKFTYNITNFEIGISEWFTYLS